jgi:ribosomal protein L37E
MQCTQCTHAQQQRLRRILWDLKANEKKSINIVMFETLFNN